MTTGHCQHGEFDITTGCPQCIADRMAEEGNNKASIAETIKAAQEVKGGDASAVERLLKAVSLPSCIVKVQYYSETTGEASDREYTYYSENPLKVGDIVLVPVRGRATKAKVSAIDVPEAEIASFKDKVKIIPAGSMVTTPPEQAAISETGDEVLGHKVAEAAPVAEFERYRIAPEETAIALRPGEDIEARGWFDEGVTALQYARDRVIKTSEDNEGASNDLSIISKLKKAMEAKKKTFLDPLKVKVDAIRDTYNYLMEPILEADLITRQKMMAYNAEQQRIRFEQEEINRKRLEAAQAEMRLKGELSESTNLIKLNEEQRPTVTDLGTTGMTAHRKYEVTDFTLLPDEYKVIDNAQLSAIAKSHHDKKQVPGVRFFNEPSITNRAR